jgi:hypothetical protein
MRNINYILDVWRLLKPLVQKCPFGKLFDTSHTKTVKNNNNLQLIIIIIIYLKGTKKLLWKK